jgi:hypothetical protein
LNAAEYQKLQSDPNFAIALNEYEKMFRVMANDPANARLAARFQTKQHMIQFWKVGDDVADQWADKIEEYCKERDAKPKNGGATAAVETKPHAETRYDEYKSYLEAIFKPGDVISFVGIEHNVTDPNSERVLQIFATLEDALTKESFSNLMRTNTEPSTVPGNTSSSIYVAMNTYPAELIGLRKGRTQENVVAVRALQADMDDANAAAVVAAMQSSAKVPPPSIVVESSTGKRQGIWLVDDFSKEDAKPVMQAIAAEFGTDSAVAEIARVMRVPGFVNRKPKYTDQPVAKILSNTGVRYTRSSFKFDLNASQKFERNPEGWLDEPFLRGNIYNQVLKFVGHYMGAKNIDNGDEMFALIKDRIERNGCYERDGVTPFAWSEEQVRQQCHKLVNEWETGEEQSKPLNLNQKPDAPVTPATSTAPTLLIPDDDPTWEYSITREDFEQQMDNEFPVLPLKLKVGPTWDDDVMYGICGDIVRKAAEFCEAHPAGMYLDLLVSLGNLIGREPYFNISATQHHANEFVVRVGDSSISRKGTGRDAVNEVLKMVDANWYTGCVKNGFGSAESIINQIRDDSVQSVRKRKNNTFENVVVPGVKDKRLMIREGELASIFQLAGKPESRADIVLRDGWDGHPLNNLVKGKTEGLSNSGSCQFPHISISADTTAKELIARMPKGAESNGFGNRFLYCYVQRVKLCANGGPAINWARELERLHEALSFARDFVRYVGMQNSARVLWSRMYTEIEKEQDHISGLAASMTARAAAHVRRLALILCLLDNKDCIETVHLRAAKKIWDYCQDSARFIFGGLTRDQEMILGWLRKNGPATLPQVTQQLFQKHRKAAWVRLQVNGLIATAKVELQGDQIVAKA